MKNIKMGIFFLIMGLVVGCAHKDEINKQDNAIVTVKDLDSNLENDTVNYTQKEELPKSTDIDKTTEIVNEEKIESEDVEDIIETPIADYMAMTEYMKDLESINPEIIIYNEDEGYIIRMKENQHYQLKKTDKILFNKGLDGYGFKVALGNQTSEYPEYVEYKPDYSGWNGEEEFLLRNISTKNALTCYLTAPTE